MSYVGVVEPEYKFVDRRGILVAHSISCINHSKTIVQVLNPSTDAVTLRNSERIGKFTSLEEASAVVCTLDTPNRQSSMEIEAAIKSLEEKAESTLVPLEKAQLTALLHKYQDIISVNGEVGRTNKVQHKIDTQQAAPIKQPPRRLPGSRRKEVRKLLDKMLEQHVIEPAHGPWASPIVLV